MTDQLDDLDDLKTAMRAATPVPDPTRRAQDIAMSVAQFEQHQKATLRRSDTLVRRITNAMKHPKWAGLATGATAVVAVGVLVLPEQGLPPAPTPALLETAPAMMADDVVARAELADAPAATMSARQSPTAEIDTGAVAPSVVAQDPLSILRAQLGNLTRSLPAYPANQYALPWDMSQALSDNGTAGAPDRFALAAPTVTNRRAVPEDIRFIIALRGFIAVSEANGPLNDWSQEDAIELAASAAGNDMQIEILALMRAFAAN